jgi:hypothetical protein
MSYRSERRREEREEKRREEREKTLLNIVHF